VFKNVICILII